MKMEELPVPLTLSKMVQLILVNGLMRWEMVSAFRSGLTVHATKDNGVLTKPMARASSIMQMVMSTKVSGLTTKLKEWVVTHTLTEPITRESGMTISNMGTELSLGQMVHDTMEYI